MQCVCRAADIRSNRGFALGALIGAARQDADQRSIRLIFEPCIPTPAIRPVSSKTTA
jgi:hypothetical protein